MNQYLPSVELIDHAFMEADCTAKMNLHVQNETNFYKEFSFNKVLLGVEQQCYFTVTDLSPSNLS